MYLRVLGDAKNNWSIKLGDGKFQNDTYGFYGLRSNGAMFDTALMRLRGNWEWCLRKNGFNPTLFIVFRV